MTYNRPISVGDEIWAIYNGINMGTERNPTNSHLYSSSQIYVFDWSGNPLAKYNIGKYIISVTVDNVKREIYTLSSPNIMSAECKLYRYKY